MGRLMLNVLLSFAKFEREIISERTRDKMAAARRKGKWGGGLTPLGYDNDREGCKIVVNEDEAVQVRGTFELYLECQSIIQTIKEIDRRGWKNKLTVTKSGKERGGRNFDKSSLFKLLKNVAYLGKVRYKEEIHEGVCIYDGRFAPASFNCGCRKATELVSRAFCRTCLILRTSGYTPDCGLRGFLFRRLDR